jgi:hypothetical protein
MRSRCAKIQEQSVPERENSMHKSSVAEKRGCVFRKGTVSGGGGLRECQGLDPDPLRSLEGSLHQ